MVNFIKKIDKNLGEVIIISDAKNDFESVQAEYEYLRKKYKNYKLKKQFLVEQNGKSYDKMELVLPGGKTKTICFGITPSKSSIKNPSDRKPMFKDNMAVAKFCLVMGIISLFLFPLGSIILFIAAAVNYWRYKKGKK